ncbi:DUF4352 domain-containing protein [Patescibacteria group bacterium]|nr:DUF4352 domain-containing protein [Patescibacteria group bacterium]
MDTTRWIAVGIAVVVLVGGGAYWWSSSSQTDQITNANGPGIATSEAGSGDNVSRESAQTGELTTTAQLSASAFATKVERYTQQRDLAKLYDLVCPQDRVGATKAEYVKALTNVWGSNRITSFEIKSVLEEDNGTTVQLVENTSDGKSEVQLMVLEKSGSGWCFRSNITNVISQIKNFQNISLTVTNFKRPYIEQYQTSVEEGHERVRINVSITNSGDKPLICHALDGGETQCSEFFFYLKDAAGAIYTMVLTDAKMPTFTLAPHATVTGSLGFEIPVNSSGYTLVFKDLGYGTDIATAPTGF